MDPNSAVPHYCVVKTYEAGRPVLTTVPSGWISGKYLHWPPKKVESLRRDVRSQPGATWSKMACKIKRRYIPTFNAAEQELAEMSGVTTDSDVGGPPAVKKMRKKASEYGTSSGMDFNSHFKSKDAAADSATSQGPSVKNPIVPEVILIEPRSLNTTVPQTFTIPWPENPLDLASQAVEPTNNASNIVTSVVNLEQASIDLSILKEEIFEKIETTKHEIVNSVTLFIEEMMAKTMAAMRSDFEAKLERFQDCNPSMNEVKLGAQLTFHPVSSIEELQQLETDLEDEEYARKLMRHMKQIIGTTGDQYNGQNVCYELVDKFFDRQFMTQCSWTGQSRTDVQKHAIQNFKKTLDVFFSIIKSVNEHFSQKALNDFFKSITRNSKKRSEAKFLRQSAVKRRGRKNTNVLNASQNQPDFIDANQLVLINNADANQPNQTIESNSTTNPTVITIVGQNGSADVPNEFDEFNLRMMHGLMSSNGSGSISESDSSFEN
ncbi:uncharacterized protein LOC110678638 isoform X2 [Aedes aegypti]|uniref:DUF4806 domain-containing protein n=1 Tax=Aedes aegypti TaxID=7159 RepID=A0A6I8TPQ2_AEDAE|nr:uncharacterized protein LOC110678638 isoform X2 [Aedes aegypti]